MADEMAAVRAARRRRLRRQRLRARTPGGRPGPGWRPTWPRSRPRRPPWGRRSGAPSWDDDDYAGKVEALVAGAPGRGQLHLRGPRRRGRAVAAARAGSLVLLTVTTPEEAARALRVGPDALCLQGCGGGRPPGQPGQRRSPRPGPARPLAPGRGPAAHPGARSWRRAAWAGPRTSPTSWPAARTSSRPGRPSCAAPRAGPPRPHKEALADPAFERTARHPRLQRAPGPGAGQRDGARPPRRAGGLPRDQQRHPAPPGGGGAGRRRPAHEPLRGDGLPPRPRRARPARSSNGWCQDGAGEQRRQPNAETIEFTPPDVAGVADALAHAARRGSGWINLLPGDRRGRGRRRAARRLFAFFGNRAPPVTMATVMPAKKDRRDTEGMTVGLMHPTGAKAVARLAEVGVARARGLGGAPGPRPAGLVLRTPVDAPEADVSPGACGPAPRCAGPR